MEVEGCDETHHQVPSSVVEIDVPIAQGCDPKSPPITSTTSPSDAMAHTTTATTMLEGVVEFAHDPAPRSISEVEMRVLQVSNVLSYVFKRGRSVDFDEKLLI